MPHSVALIQKNLLKYFETGRTETCITRVQFHFKRLFIHYSIVGSHVTAPSESAMRSFMNS